MARHSTTKQNLGRQRSALAIILLCSIVLVPVAARIATRYFVFPDNWYTSVTVLGLADLLVSLWLLCRRERREKVAMLRSPTVRLDDQEVIYQSQQNEMHFIKNLQWNVTYYFILGTRMDNYIISPGRHQLVFKSSISF